MRRGFATAFLASAAILVAQPAVGQDVFFYPSQGQTPEKQNQDFGECHAWAVQQSGFNPMAQQGGPPQEAAQGGVVRGAARGAAGGAVIGAITGNVGKGAAIGAAGGGLVGGFRRSDQKRQQKQAKNQHKKQQSAGRKSYNRAVSACMQGRGYAAS